MKRLSLFMFLFLAIAAIASAQGGLPFESSVEIPERFNILASVRSGANVVHYSTPVDGQIAGSGLTQTFELSAESTRQTGFYFAVQGGYQSVSVSTRFIENLRRTAWFVKSNIGLTDGRYFAGGLATAFFRSDTGDADVPAFGLFLRFRHRVFTDRVFLSVYTDVQAQLSDQFTAMGNKPLASTLSFGLGYQL